MIKSVGIDELHKHEFSYITGITKPQIKTLLKNGAIQLKLFDKDVCEVADNGVRYILRRNPTRAAEMQATRTSKLERLREKAKAEVAYLEAHPLASETRAERRLQAAASRLLINSLVKIVIAERQVSVEVIEDSWKKAAELDGCYVLKTDLPAMAADKEMVHKRYKDLAKVERGFRTIKTGLLEVRPIWLRKKNRTQAHVFVCMLAYLVSRQIEKITGEDETVNDALQQLNRIATVEMVLGNASIPTIPAPPAEIQSILNRLEVSLPTVNSAPRKTKPRKSA
jgi:transposase